MPFFAAFALFGAGATGTATATAGAAIAADIAIASVASSIGGGVMAYQGQQQQAQAAEDQAKDEQAILNYNASLKEKEAKAQEDRARAEARRFEREGDALIGQQKGMLAKGGVLLSTGTPALLLEETAEELAADKRQILKDGYLRGSRSRSEAIGLRYQGSAARARGSNIAKGHRTASYGSLLTGIGRGASIYADSQA